MSVYLPELNTLFVHIPRTGGTWIARVLEAAGIECVPAPGAGTHNLPERYAVPPGEKGECFRFVFVRHPLTWLESAWRGLHGSWPLPEDRQEQRAMFTEKTFAPFRILSRRCGRNNWNEFCRAVLEREAGFVSRMFEWYAGASGAPKVDAVGQMEHLPGHLTQILKRVGWHGKLPALEPENVGEGDMPEWEPGLRKRILESESAGISRWYGAEKGPFFVSEAR